MAFGLWQRGGLHDAAAVLQPVVEHPCGVAGLTGFREALM